LGRSEPILSNAAHGSNGRNRVVAFLVYAVFLQDFEAARMVMWLSTEDRNFDTDAVFDLSGGRATY